MLIIHKLNFTLQSSVVCKAAIQTGAIKSVGGHVVWHREANVTSFVAGTKNGIISYAKPG